MVCLSNLIPIEKDKIEYHFILLKVVLNQGDLRAPYLSISDNFSRTNHVPNRIIIKDITYNINNIVLRSRFHLPLWILDLTDLNLTKFLKNLLIIVITNLLIIACSFILGCDLPNPTSLAST